MNKEENQDPIAMYIILRESLLEEMTVGKQVAAGAHASQELQRQYGKLDTRYNAHENNMSPAYMSDAELARYWLYYDWLKEGVRKIVLRANDKEWSKLKEEFKNEMVIIRDAGYTCVEPGSEVSIGLWPRRKSMRSKLLKGLQVL